MKSDLIPDAVNQWIPEIVLFEEFKVFETVLSFEYPDEDQVYYWKCIFFQEDEK